MIILDSSRYDRIARPLSQVAVNHLFARSVVEHKVIGAVYVDHVDSPRTFYVRHPYGMGLLFGDTENADFNTRFLHYALNTERTRNHYEWLQAYPDSWNKKLTNLFGDRLVKFQPLTSQDHPSQIEEHTRVNFRFNKTKYFAFKSKTVKADYPIVRTNQEMFLSMTGAVVPKYFWRDAEHFCRDGVGFSLICDNQPASTAFSAFIHEHQLELGIETIASCQGKGLAHHSCSALIDYCLANNYEPIWSCRLENTGSYKLAQTLGFEPVAFIPYYRLPF